MKKVNSLFDEVENLKKKYENHFNVDFPDNIIGWWDPLNIESYPDELESGVKQMRKDINKAINKNKQIESISDKEFNEIVF